MGRRVHAFAESVSKLFAGRPYAEMRLGVRLVPTRCNWCEDWMVICEGKSDLAPVELRPGRCPACREQTFEGVPVAAAAGG
ncbi:MAG: hypothetical protein JRG96_00545 [Deltaproteobacteria bacterium]|nr:hypothetical protein [Deltaproteobacteria bacterium]MBW2419899.1 hypothetical protein [Deltaproteobacteria bacterium]